MFIHCNAHLLIASNQPTSRDSCPSMDCRAALENAEPVTQYIQTTSDIHSTCDTGTTRADSQSATLDCNVTCAHRNVA